MLFRFAGAAASVLSLAVSGGAESGVPVVSQPAAEHGLVAVQARPQQPSPPQTTPPAPQPPAPSGPFSNLFKSPLAPAPAGPRVACGMTVVPVSPSYDAAIRKPAPTKPKPAARVVPTPACR